MSAPTRTLLLSILQWAVVYGLLIAAWPLVGNLAADAYRGTNNVLYGSSFRDCTIEYRVADVAEYADTNIVVRNDAKQIEGVKPVSARYRVYFPTAMLIALVLASPVPWRRRAWALLGGLAILWTLVFLREGLILLEVLSAPRNPVSTIDLGTLQRKLVRSVARPLSLSVTIAYIMPVLVWIPLTFRARDWTRAFGDGGSQPDAR